MNRITGKSKIILFVIKVKFKETIRHEFLPLDNKMKIIDVVGIEISKKTGT